MRLIYVLFTFLWLWNTASYGQMFFRLSAVPGKFTPTLDTIFLAGNFNNWNPRDTSYRFQKNGQGQWQVSISTSLSALQFKVTRGSWATVEVAANGQDIPNRTATFTQGQTIDFPVADWADTKGNHTTTEQVSILTSQLWLKALKRYRRIWVCLPPDYSSNPNRRYPVIYLHDGQNVFDAATSFAGEWKVDEALQTLSNQPGWEPVIAVAVDNGGGERINELTPFRNPTYGGGQGELYGKALVEDVKPLIDSLFRTKKDRINTALGGSSLGGIETLYMGFAWPQIYSKLLVFSPSLWYSDSLQQFIFGQPQLPDVRMYLLAGTNESASMIAETNSFYNGLISNGFLPSNISKNIISGGTHSEGFWSQYVKVGLEFLFSPTTEIKKKSGLGEENYWIILREKNEIQFQKPEEKSIEPEIVMFDILGKIQPLEKLSESNWRFRPQPAGVYMLRIQWNGKVYAQKFVLE